MSGLSKEPWRIAQGANLRSTFSLGPTTEKKTALASFIFGAQVILSIVLLPLGVATVLLGGVLLAGCWPGESQTASPDGGGIEAISSTTSRETRNLPTAAPGRRGEQSRPIALASMSVLADLVRNVAGDRLEVRSLVPVGVDVHTFQPAPADVASISAARVVFVNGLGLEQTMMPVLRNNAAPGVPIIELAAGLDTDSVEPEEDSPSAMADGDSHPTRDEHHEPVGPTPHLWLDPQNAARYVERIRDALTAVDPEGAEEYRRNAESYLAVLRSLDRELEERLSAIPPHRRRLVTFHDAFQPLARRYGFELIGVVVRDPGREPAARDVAVLVERIREQAVPAVYTEPQFNARVLEMAARDSGVRLMVLYSDTLDEKVRSYVDMMRFNSEQLVNGLR